MPMESLGQPAVCQGVYPSCLSPARLMEGGGFDSVLSGLFGGIGREQAGEELCVCPTDGMCSSRSCLWMISLFPDSSIRYRYCRMLEEGSFRGRTADFVFMFLFGGLLMTVSFSSWKAPLEVAETLLCPAHAGCSRLLAPLGWA